MLGDKAIFSEKTGFSGKTGFSRKIRSNRAYLLATAAAVICVAVSGAQAQDVRGESVSERDRPEYDPVGLRVGSFFINPSLALTEAYDDNVRAANTSTVEDFVTTINPHVTVSSNWSRHELIIEGDLESKIFAEESNENFTNWSGEARGRVDITQNTDVTGSATFAQLHEDRGASNAAAAANEPTEYSRADVTLAVNQRFNRLSVSVGGSFTDLDYDDVAAIGGGLIDNDFRDREIYQGLVRLGYEVSPATNVFVQGTYNDRDYDQAPPVVGLNRDSSGYEIVVGSQFDLTGVTTGEVFVGYQEQDYDSAVLPTVDGISYGAEVRWYATSITTVTAYAASTVEEAVTAGASGFLRQTGELAVEHELLRNVIASGAVVYRNEDYEGIARNDDYIQLNLGADYLINRNFTVGFDYDFVQRDSSVPGIDFDRNIFGVTLKAQI